MMEIIEAQHTLVQNLHLETAPGYSPQTVFVSGSTRRSLLERHPQTVLFPSQRITA